MEKRYKAQIYDRHSTLTVEAVMAKIKELHETTPQQLGRLNKTFFNGIHVKLGGLRMRTFAEKGTICSRCGLVAQCFAIERDKSQAAQNGPYHLNLYADVHGEHMLFTHDHTLARGLGGSNTIDNATTMCAKCNWEKSLEEQAILLHYRQRLPLE